MNAAEHRDGIISRWSEMAKEKYDKGQAEHGGKLWEKTTLDAAIEESIDLPMYLFTLKDQIGRATELLIGYLNSIGTNENIPVIKALGILLNGVEPTLEFNHGLKHFEWQR